MEYIELDCRVTPAEPGNDILMAELAEIGYESFADSDTGFKAYIQAKKFEEKDLKNLSFFGIEDFSFEYSFKKIADQNWNAKWEENYPPVVIDKVVAIRAPFHEPFKNVDYDIVIEPKMSFGTAHHPTTAQMISLILEMDIKGLTVLDMGSGTAVLAILASLRGASTVDAIDNDEWAYNNAVENVMRNSIPNIHVELGDATLLKDRKYDLIIANINRNILLEDMKHYASCLSKGNSLLLSGFYEEDIAILNKEAEKYGLIYQKHTLDRGWAAGVWKLNT